MVEEMNRRLDNVETERNKNVNTYLMTNGVPPNVIRPPVINAYILTISIVVNVSQFSSDQQEWMVQMGFKSSDLKLKKEVDFK